MYIYILCIYIYSRFKVKTFAASLGVQTTARIVQGVRAHARARTHTHAQLGEGGRGGGRKGGVGWGGGARQGQTQGEGEGEKSGERDGERETERTA
jgi:hypothetical protein